MSEIGRGSKSNGFLWCYSGAFLTLSLAGAAFNLGCYFVKNSEEPCKDLGIRIFMVVAPSIFFTLALGGASLACYKQSRPITPDRVSLIAEGQHSSDRCNYSAREIGRKIKEWAPAILIPPFGVASMAWPFLKLVCLYPALNKTNSCSSEWLNTWAIVSVVSGALFIGSLSLACYRHCRPITSDRVNISTTDSESSD